MSLTKEMMFHTESEVSLLDNDMLVVYYQTHSDLNRKYPNSFYNFKIKTAFHEILNRGIEDRIMDAEKETNRI